MIKIPPYLKKGDTIGITCPAGYMAAEKVQTCVEALQQWGYKVIAGNTVGGKSTTYFSGTDGERLTELQQMLDNENIAAILCGRGGYGMGRIVEQIDFKKFKRHPKWIIGFSDITILHTHIHTHYGISTLHAPMAAAFNEEGYKNEYVQSLKKTLAGKRTKYTCNAYELNRKGKASGTLIGGNLSLLAHVTGTSSDIKTKGKILFIEEVGEYLYSADRMLYQLKRSGKLDKLAGLIIGGFTEMKDTKRPFGKTIYEIIADVVKTYNYPVCMGFPVGHGKENYALKVGAVYHLNVTPKKVMLEETR
ncbi:LD-carboxypeptidase [Agriterribacter sp.]|uniref:S66 peptidase family protein n=1 Tax=Agriterribacter sp. TaxID=2821509 RepID=UPI002BB114EB|nr:LD-carboxypeptidase [Agriterribacter sp.]HRO47594.1 LD-carboxypeptidase [Agriterribacter sp.]HRQ18697.1 LD-carboxypeptidase [Agriterribacter sp.]